MASPIPILSAMIFVCLEALKDVQNQMRTNQVKKVELTERVSSNAVKKQRLSESLFRIRGDLISTMSIEELSEFRKETM